MVYHCSYCKKEVIMGLDAKMKKDGTCAGVHKSCAREMHALQIQYAHLLLGNICKCCGSRENIQAGHINYPEDVIKKDKHRKTGFTVCSGDKIGNVKFLKLIENGDVVPVCGSCNISMGNGVICRIHQKYLGKFEDVESMWRIWNPSLDDLKEGSE